MVTVQVDPFYPDDPNHRVPLTNFLQARYGNLNGTIVINRGIHTLTEVRISSYGQQLLGNAYYFDITINCQALPNGYHHHYLQWDQNPPMNPQNYLMLLQTGNDMVIR